MSPFSSIDDTFKTIDHWSKSSPVILLVTSNSNEKHCYKKTEQSSNPNKLIADAFAIFGCSMSDDQSMEAAESSTFCHIDPAVKRISHNAIERRYRNNINERICELKNAVPALYMANIDKEQRASCSGDSSDNDDNSTNERHRSKEHMNEIVDGVEVARKLNKATILRKATEYIYHLKRTIAIAEQESQILQYILTQVPQGDSLLSSFHQRQFQIRQAEQEKKMHERRVAAQREKLIRERVLRERAVERASVAKLLPKRERKPYRRRTKQEIDEQRSVGKQDKTSLACHSSSSINHFSSPSVL
ncbi:helix-loop-helix DNA-binding domain-containing protein [Blakeslea trispora]|nr:helix-loop-helix DNA-binding domain-containing protein [Blakeslea trispora]